MSQTTTDGFTEHMTRPPGTPEPGMPTKSGKNTAVGCLACIVIVAVLSAAIWGCASCAGSDDGMVPTDAKDVKTVELVTAACDTLATVTAQMTAGDATGAAAGFASVNEIYPRTDNVYIQALSDDYIEYMSQVRYYILGQTTLPTVDDARADVEGDLLAMQPE